MFFVPGRTLWLSVERLVFVFCPVCCLIVVFCGSYLAQRELHVLLLLGLCHYKNTPIQILENFTSKTENFQIRNSDIFHTSAQNINCRYSLEPPRRSGSNEYPQSML